MDRTIFIRCTYGIYGREITRYTVVYGAYTYKYKPMNITTCLPCVIVQSLESTLVWKEVYAMDGALMMHAI